MSEPTRPPMAEARDVVARAIAGYASDAAEDRIVATSTYAQLLTNAGRMADGVLAALRQSGHLAPATGEFAHLNFPDMDT